MLQRFPGQPPAPRRAARVWQIFISESAGRSRFTVFRDGTPVIQDGGQFGIIESIEEIRNLIHDLGLATAAPASAKEPMGPGRRLLAALDSAKEPWSVGGLRLPPARAGLEFETEDGEGKSDA